MRVVMHHHNLQIKGAKIMFDEKTNVINDEDLSAVAGGTTEGNRIEEGTVYFTGLDNPAFRNPSPESKEKAE